VPVRVNGGDHEKAEQAHAASFCRIPCSKSWMAGRQTASSDDLECLALHDLALSLTPDIFDHSPPLLELGVDGMPCCVCCCPSRLSASAVAAEVTWL
jgi:hypothetical protein